MTASRTAQMDVTRGRTVEVTEQSDHEPEAEITC